jgi:putative flippase GtrA
MTNFFSPIFRFVPVSGLATLVDFVTSYIAVNYLNFSVFWATVFGNFWGGIFGFVLSKYWVFQDSNNQKSHWQVVKYILVSGGNSLLNSFLVSALNNVINADYLTIRTLVGTFVFIIYSYGLNRIIVFSTTNHEKPLSQ